MLELDCIQGSTTDWVLQAVNRNGTTPSQFLQSDTLSAVVWRGENQASLFLPTVSWFSYAAGQVLLQIAGSQTSALDYAGTYHLQINVTRSGVTTTIIDCLLRVLAMPGSGTNTAVTYAAYSDVLRYCPWITMIQDNEAEQEGYYDERLEATDWLNNLILRSWRGTSAAYFGDAGRSAQFWLGSWVRRTPLPSYWLRNMLSGGVIQQPITVTAPGSGYSFANVSFTGGGGQQASATATVSGGQVIAVTLNAAGYGWLSAPTITITGDGTGATATCTISSSTLIVRTQIKRVCAYKAASIAALAQIGRMNDIANRGAFFHDLATAEADTIVAELDLNGDGIADLPVPLGSTNTMFT
jgi:hypothetical protein